MVPRTDRDARLLAIDGEFTGFGPVPPGWHTVTIALAEATDHAGHTTITLGHADGSTTVLESTSTERWPAVGDARATVAFDSPTDREVAMIDAVVLRRPSRRTIEITAPGE